MLTPLLSGGEPVKSCVSMAGVLPPCRVPVRRPTTKPKRRPTLVAGLPIRKYLTQMKRPHLKYANAPRQARRKRGRREGREGRRRYVHSCCAELHFRKAAATNAGGSPRVSQCGFRRGKPCDVDKFGFGPKSRMEGGRKNRGIRDGRRLLVHVLLTAFRVWGGNPSADHSSS